METKCKRCVATKRRDEHARWSVHRYGVYFIRESGPCSTCKTKQCKRVPQDAEIIWHRANKTQFSKSLTQVRDGGCGKRGRQPQRFVPIGDAIPSIPRQDLTDFVCKHSYADDWFEILLLQSRLPSSKNDRFEGRKKAVTESDDGLGDDKEGDHDDDDYESETIDDTLEAVMDAGESLIQPTQLPEQSAASDLILTSFPGVGQGQVSCEQKKRGRPQGSRDKKPRKRAKVADRQVVNS